MEIIEIRGKPERRVLEHIFALYMELIDRPGREYFYERIDKHPDLYTIVSYEENTLAGFKMGYPLVPGVIFYSWLGGVNIQYRRQGIARKLMEIQHEKLREENYSLIRTKTKNIYRNMLVLNILNGFDIVETYTDRFGDPKIVLEKSLI